MDSRFLYTYGDSRKVRKIVDFSNFSMADYRSHHTKPHYRGSHISTQPKKFQSIRIIQNLYNPIQTKTLYEYYPNLNFSFKLFQLPFQHRSHFFNCIIDTSRILTTCLCHIRTATTASANKRSNFLY